MTKKEPLPKSIEAKIGWPLFLTRAGIVAERITYCFWPLWTLCFLTIAALALGFADWAPIELFWLGIIATPSLFVWFFVRGLRLFRWPSHAETLTRLDEALPGRPLAALTDRQALGHADQASIAVWQAHLARMVRKVASARHVPPDLRLQARDPYALRYLALSLFVIALCFGSLWRVVDVGRSVNLEAGATIVSASWEGWAEPPAHTRLPRLYLNDLTADSIVLPKGSRVLIRLYGAPDTYLIKENLSGSAAQTEAPSGSAEKAKASSTDLRSQEFVVLNSGTLAIDGKGGRTWQVTVLDDAAPTVALAGPIERKAKGAISQPFKAHDDYAIVKGEARFQLDLGAVDRRFGLEVEPEALPDIVFDLPLPVTGKRNDFTQTLVEDASQHVWANMAVKMTLTVYDASGQSGSTKSANVILPGRRFFDPLAEAIIEVRRDLLWSRANAARSLQILRAVTNRPEGFISDENAYLMLRVAVRQLDSSLSQKDGLSTELRDELAKALWDIAILIEDGGLTDALEKMKRAQERLSEAMRNGASPEEIQRLMDDLRAATDDYLAMLAEKGAEDQAERFTENQPSKNITQDQLDQMMDEIQKLMEQGRMAEAQQLLDQLNTLMQNLKVTQGDGQGEGKGGASGQAMKNLRQTLRDQQDLSDDAFKQGQQGEAPGSSGQQSDQDGTSPGDKGRSGQQGSGSDGVNGDQGKSLADRQESLGERLANELEDLPDAQGQDAERARRALNDAGQAMNQAEEALRDGDIPKAIDRQAEAIQKLHDGLRSMDRALAEGSRKAGQDGQMQTGEEGGDRPDPLGRTRKSNSPIDDNNSPFSQPEDVYRHARDLLDDVRRRAAEQSRPKEEREYLKRLMGRF